jgi:hypothetical protein
MEPKAIVIVFNEFGNVFLQVIQVAIFGGVDFLSLERPHEALATGIVVRIRRPAHARYHAVFT